MLVLASPGLKVPLEGKPRDYITETPPEDAAGYAVPDDSAYYARRVMDGDLVVVDAEAAVAAPVKSTRKG